MTVGGRYELLRELGHGSFGRTFLARDRAGERDVAIKVLDRRGAADWKAYELFEREAAVLRSLRHHGVPEVHDSFATRGTARRPLSSSWSTSRGSPLRR